MYHQFNIQQLYVLPTHCIYVSCVDLRTNIFLCNQTDTNNTQALYCNTHKHCTYDITMRRVRVTIVVVEKQ